MKTIVGWAALRVPIVIITAFGWLALSNHCVLAAVEHGAPNTPMSCHGAPLSSHVPAKEKRDGVECCKVLRATLLSPAKNLVALDKLLFAPFRYVVAVLVLPDADEQIRGLEWDTGPPGADSFAESVLHRSILAHAPPALA